MKYQFRLTADARDDLDALDASVAERILKKLAWFSQQNNPLRFAKRLRNSQSGDYRFRIGDYRAIFDITPGGVVFILLVLRIKHRREAYD